MQTYVNPISGGQDPFFLRGHDGMYYSVYSCNRGLFVAQSERLSEPGVAHLVWTPPAEGWCSGSIWAPEIHYLRGKYYIYITTAAIDCGLTGWVTRRQAVLESDSPLGPYSEPKLLELGEEMSIDGTVMEAKDGRLYYVYMRNYVMYDMQNTLWIAPMSSPTEICGEPRPLPAPMWPWEEFVNEGPEAIRHNGRMMIVYSAHAAHTPEYCLALLTCENEDDILNKDSWTKHDTPVFRKGNGVMGPGHASMTIAPDGKTHYLVYHCKSNENMYFGQTGSMWRMVCVQPFTWNEDGTPFFGQPLPLGEAIPLPPGEAEDQPGVYLEDGITGGGLIYYGGNEHAPVVDGVAYLDGISRPEYGSKALVRDLCWDNARVSMDVRMPQGGAPDDGAMLLLRVRNAGARKFLMQGYAVRISQRFGLQILRLDGWSEPVRLGLTQFDAHRGDWLHLEAEMQGDIITARVKDAEVTIHDDTYASGRIGVAVHGDLGMFKKLHAEVR